LASIRYEYPGIEQVLETDFDYGEWVFGAKLSVQCGLKVGYSNDQAASGEAGTLDNSDGEADDKVIFSVSYTLMGTFSHINS
jgi:hypothetical protein